MNHRSHDEQELSHVQQKCSESGSKPHDEIQNVGAIDATTVVATAELAGAAAREAASSRSSCRCHCWRSHCCHNRGSHRKLALMRQTYHSILINCIQRDGDGDGDGNNAPGMALYIVHHNNAVECPPVNARMMPRGMCVES